MDYSALTINTDKDIGDEIDIVRYGTRHGTRQRQATYNGEPIFNKHGEPIMAEVEDEGPYGMRYLASIDEGMHSDLLLNMLTKINGEKTFDACIRGTYDERADVSQTYKDLYVTPYGTGDADTRERLRQMIFAMTTLGLHDGELQSAVLPLLPPEIAAMYEKNPTGETLWLGYTGTRVCDLSLPERIVEPELYPYNQHQNDITSAVFGRDNPNGEGWFRYIHSWMLSYPDAVWGTRIINFLNERAGEPACIIDDDGKSVLISDKYSDDQIDFIVDTFVDKRPFLGGCYSFIDNGTDTIAQLISDRILLDQYREVMKRIAAACDENDVGAMEQAANAARNIAWVALTGTDPRIYDEPIDVANLEIKYNLRDMIEEPFCVDILGYCDRNDEYDFDDR